MYVRWSRRREGTTFLQSRVRGMSEEEESVIAGVSTERSLPICPSR